MNCSSCNYLIAMPPAYATCIASCNKNENFDHDNELSDEERLQREAPMSMLSIYCCLIIMVIYAITLVKQCNGGFLEFLGLCEHPVKR